MALRAPVAPNGALFAWVWDDEAEEEAQAAKAAAAAEGEEGEEEVAREEGGEEEEVELGEMWRDCATAPAWTESSFLLRPPLLFCNLGRQTDR